MYSKAIKTCTLYLFSLILFASIAYSLDFSVNLDSPTFVNYYEGDKISDQFSFTITNHGSFCDISCDWVTSAGQGSGVKASSGGSTSNRAYFDVLANGANGVDSYTLIITCNRNTEPLNCFSGTDQKTGERQFSYLWNGDGICTTSKEKCASYKTYLKDSACTCQSSKTCNPSSSRGSDSTGCTTYCGNGIKESQFETCTNCPDDVGKCDGQWCTGKTECEGNYCVHNKCSHTSYVKGDSYCDSSLGETCINSPSDCGCSSGEQCNSRGVCETYCGNGICESKEQGICKADCDWCGDGVCDANKESCKGCHEDCGECEKTDEQEQVGQQLLQIKEEAEFSAKRTKDNRLVINIAVGSTLGLIILLVIGYLIYKKIKNKSPVKETKSKQTNKNKCPKCHANVSGKPKFCSSCGYKLK